MPHFVDIPPSCDIDSTKLQFSALFRCTGDRYVEYHSPNIWPREIPDLELCFKEMGSMMHESALLIADLFDR